MVFLISEDLGKRGDRLAIGLISILSLGFIGLIALAIYFYPDTYSFFSNYLSDLGMTVTSPHNYDNSTSSMIFTVAMVVVGILSFAFWAVSQNVLRYNVKPKLGKKATALVILGCLLGIASSPFGAAIGFFHYNTDKSMHLTMGWIFFILASGACLIYSVLFIYLFMSDTSRQNTYTITALIFTVIGAVGLYFMIKDNLASLIMPIIIGFLLLVMVLNVFSYYKFKILISYLSFFVSFIFIVSIIAVLALYFTVGLKEFIEVTFIVIISAFLMTNNLELFKIEKEDSV